MNGMIETLNYYIGDGDGYDDTNFSKSRYMLQKTQPLIEYHLLMTFNFSILVSRPQHIKYMCQIQPLQLENSLILVNLNTFFLEERLIDERKERGMELTVVIVEFARIVRNIDQYKSI